MIEPKEFAKKLVEILPDGWRRELIVSEKGRPTPCIHNVITALRLAPEWRGVLAVNEFAKQIVTRKATPWGSPPPIVWNDRDDVLAASWMNQAGIAVAPMIVHQAIKAVAADQAFHPVREYLDALTWDGTHRIDQWLDVFMEAEQTPFLHAVSSRWLISAVARIYQPGCKADCALVLEGPQGKCKSMALQILGGEWFSDDLAQLGSKDASMQLAGRWIMEIAELDSMSRAEVSTVKAFISRATDIFRPPYGHHVIEAPRSCVFAGTVNLDTWNPDSTGGRRFWPVRCVNIHADELRKHRDQIWAEARQRYRNGDIWWLDTPELNSAAEEEQGARYQADAWEAPIANWLRLQVLNGKATVSTANVLRLCLEKPAGQWTRADEMRVSKALKVAGWVRFRGPRPEQEWLYRPDPNLSDEKVGSSDEVGHKVGHTEDVESKLF